MAIYLSNLMTQENDSKAVAVARDKQGKGYEVWRDSKTGKIELRLDRPVAPKPVYTVSSPGKCERCGLKTVVTRDGVDKCEACD